MKDPSAAQADQADRLLASVGIGVPAGEEITVFRGDTVRVTATIDHMGAATTATLAAYIGDRGIIFNAHWSGIADPVTLPESIDWVTHTLSVDVPITGTGRGGLFDIYVKILETGAPGMPELANVIRVVGPGEFQNFAIASYDKV